MKKIILSLLATAGLFTSCDMDLYPNGYILEEDALQTVSDAEAFRNGFYNSLRIIGSGYIQATEIQADMFIGTIINGNRMGELNNGEIYTNLGEAASGFGGMYGQVSSVNYFLPRAASILEDELLTEEDEDNVKLYVAEALFTRAFCYYWLLDHFCQSYDGTNGDTPALGVPLQEVYNPSPILSTYPGRSTLNETYAFIENDLDSCYKTFTYFEDKYKNSQNEKMSQQVQMMTSQMATYVGSWTVRALQARLALLKQDWQKAYDYSNEIIASRKFPLVAALSFASMWKNDTGSEIIFMPYVDTDELGGISAMGTAWLTSDDDKADYIPTGAALRQYGLDDVRLGAYFGQREINVYGMEILVPTFTKFPGNPAFNRTSSNAMINRPKMFRSAEQYLINMEAACHLGGHEDEVNTMLNLMRKTRTKRGGTYTEKDYSGEQLLGQVQLERTRELIGEGFRISDLRRWGLEFERSIAYSEAQYDEAASVTVVAGRTVNYEVNDHRYVWPIPAEEMQSNPQLNGQQNPGY